VSGESEIDMKKQFFLISSLIMAVTASAWWVFSPGDAAPQLVVRLNGIALPAHRADPAAKAQQLVSLSDEARAELFRPGGRFEFSPVAGLSLSVEVERVEPNEDGSRVSHGAVEGEPGSQAVFSEVEGAMAGSVQLANGRLFTINPVAPGVHRVAEVDFTTGLLDCGSCRGETPSDLPRGVEMAFQSASRPVDTQVLRANLRSFGKRRGLRGARLSNVKRISSRKTVKVVVTGKNKKNGLQAQKKKPGKSGLAQTGSKTTTTRRTGTNSKTKLATKKPANTTKKPANKKSTKKSGTSSKKSSKKNSGKGNSVTSAKKNTKKNTVTTGGSSRVDLMVVYTPGAAKMFGGEKGIKARINVAVSRSNTAFSESKIKARLNLVHAGQVDYTSTGSKSTDLMNLSFRKSSLRTQVADLRKKYSADLVTLVTERDGGGVGFLLNRKSPTPQLGFNVVCGRSLYYSVLAHECGHNLGCQHAKGDPGMSKSMEKYGFGWRVYANDGKKTRQYRTIMAYSPGRRVGHFSNPNVKYQGVPTGMNGKADNAKVINATASIVARNSEQ